MISYTKRYVNIVSLILTIIIYFITNNNIISLKNIDFNPNSIFNLLRKNIIQVEINSNNINQKTKENSKNYYPILNSKENIQQIIPKESNWKIIIPSISLEAQISEGTSKEVMNKFVGHFEETVKTNGNIGLAAHNRGYEVNYFSNLKKLKEGDEIIYKFNEFEKRYKVQKHVIIKDTDWSYLEKTKENKITLITCIENEPEYRRCIQGVEE